jgi:hypothetical protein
MGVSLQKGLVGGEVRETSPFLFLLKMLSRVIPSHFLLYRHIASLCNDTDMVDFIELQKSFADSPKSWSVDVRSLSEVEGYDLSVKNPDSGEVVVHRSPLDIMDEIAALDAESAEVLTNIKGLLSYGKGA